MLPSKLAKRVGWALGAAFVFAYLYGLGAAPLFGADEPRYAEVAREMYARRDLVTPTLGGLRWFEKPALGYWLVEAGYGAFGVNELAARLGSACAGLLTVFSVWALARSFESPDGGGPACGLGLVCGGLLASTAGLIVFSRGLNFDVLLTAALTAALSCFLAADLAPDARRRRRLLAGFYASLGLALLSKGLLGLVLPGMIIPLYYLLAGRRPALGRLGLPWGLPLTLAVAGVWYGPVIWRHGHEFVDQFFVQHHFARFASNKYHHPQPFYFYVPVVLLLALPWTPFFVGALGALGPTALRDETGVGRLRVFALAWLAAPVLFFSFSGSKLPGYVLPALPAAAVLAGLRLHSYLRGEGGLWVMRVTAGLALGLGAGGAVYLGRSGLLPAAVALAGAAPAVAAGACALLFARRRLVAASSIVAAALLTVPLVAALAFGHVAGRESVRGPLLQAQARGLGHLPVLQLHTTERSSEFYAAGRLVYAADGQPRKFEGAGEVLAYVRGAGGRALVIVPVKYLNQLTGEASASAEVIGDNGWKAVVYVETAGG